MRNVSQSGTRDKGSAAVEADHVNPHTFAADLDGLRRSAVETEALAAAAADMVTTLPGEGRAVERVQALAIAAERSAGEVLAAADRVVARLDGAPAPKGRR